MQKKLIALAAAALTLGACSGIPASESAATSGANRPSASSESPTSSAPEPAPEETGPEVLAFGKTVTYDNGVSLTVTKDGTFTPSEYAVVEGAEAYVKFTVTVVNGSDKPFDPVLIYATVQSTNVEAEAVFDMDNGLEGPSSTQVLPGRETTFPIGFGVADPKDIVMEIAPGFEYGSTIFTTQK